MTTPASRPGAGEPLGAEPIPAERLQALGHELRAPLAAIHALADALLGGHLDAIGEARRAEYLTGIRDTARHALQVAERLLGPGERAGWAVPQPATTDVNAIALEIVAGMTPLAERYGGRLNMALAPGPLAARVDATSLRQMTINLLANALQHGGPAVNANVLSGREPSGRIWLEITDTGQGIPREVIRQVELGMRTSPQPGDAPAMARCGLGLGLTRTLAEANGGTLALASDAGGTRARLSFCAAA